MTQYQRITGKVFGGNATATGNDPQIAQFGSALANTFVGTTDPETIQQLPAWGQGWIGAVTPETQFPPMPEMTGVMKVLSHQICGILQQGVSTWDSGTIYYTGNYVSLNGRLYISQVDENQGNNPTTDTTNWQELANAIIEENNTVWDGQWVNIGITSLASNISVSTTPTEFDVAPYLPVDGYKYRVLVAMNCWSSNSGNPCTCWGEGEMNNNTGFVAILPRASSVITLGTGYITVGTERKVRVCAYSGTHERASISMRAYRRLGTNQ